ncbi:flagellar basal-body MS-ring/collar protein FliF [Kerstersia gyiorum]|uniref:Flagellar M-ring protein n=1 Tax=Kerstersia gyiorum TaxID=206506 RepID=A0A171KRE9_9BURK|nr:flagellar basal-body MS-ring/collar protein FliF [Kerstersia gyiorum]KKO71466.1 flagellar M-ring protein FliF [Kerstersia gyiorum]
MSQDTVPGRLSGFFTRFPQLAFLARVPKPALLGAGALAIALLAVALLWSRGPEYRVLFSNIEERDGGAIVTALTQMNVPYRFSDSGTALLVPAEKVHETRLALAAQGLPKGGSVGFELLDNPRFGASQFSEQVSYQRGLEGELARSIESLHAVERARVHLALPRQSLFVRERQKPTASVLLTLYPGRQIDHAQVTAISWLLASSVPNLHADDISVVDQSGRLLSTPQGEEFGFDADQQRRARQIEQRAEERILALLNPLLGSGNVHARVTADLDVSRREQTSESYRPNQSPNEAAVRSRQSNRREQTGLAPAGGPPGALSNQPAPAAVAPIDAPATGNAASQAEAGKPAAPAAPTQSSTDETINYEVDRTIEHVRTPAGEVRRLSVAVVLNYLPDAQGVPQPLSPEDMAKIEGIVRDAVGYSEARGDSVSLANSPFTENLAQTDEPPFWRDPFYLDLGQSMLQYLLYLLLALFAWRAVIRPILNQRNAPTAAPAAPATAQSEAQLQQIREAQSAALREQQLQAEKHSHEKNLAAARELAQKDPRAVAMIIRAWMEGKNG